MWLYVPASCLTQASSSPETLSASLPGAGALTWDSASLLPMLAAFATWRGKSLQPKSWQRVLRTALSTTRLCGLTCLPSTAARGAALWMESLAASRAKTSALPESGQASSAATAPDSSSSTRGSFAKFNPDGSLSKTSEQCSLFQQEESFSESFPPWGLMWSGALWKLPTWEPRTNAIGSSFWPTALTQDVNIDRGLDDYCVRHNENPSRTQSLAARARLWSTPTTRD